MSPLPFSEDIPDLLSDLGVVVVLGSDTVKGILERESDVAIDEGLEIATEVNTISVAVEENALSGLVYDAAITVDGTAYKVRRFFPHPRDHYLTRIFLVTV